MRKFAFEREHRLLVRPVRTGFRMSEERVSERLRYFATDLYSVLDYLCYLCYCRYKKNGKVDHSEEARNVKFPYKKLKKSDFDDVNDSCRNQTRKFLWAHFNTIFNYTFRLPDEIGPLLDEATQQRYERFKEIIEKCQVVTKVDSQGQPVLQDQEQRQEAKSFSTLHYLRNITVHRNLIDIAVENAWLYVNLQDGSHEISVKRPERNNNPQNWQSIQVGPGCWITLPSVGSNRFEAETLHAVLNSLLDFVIDTRNKLLRMVSDQIPEYNPDTVRTGLNDGVKIGPRGDRTNTVSYTWTEFDEKCHIHEDNSYLWAV